MEQLKELPAPADTNEIASIARQGILGQCLQEALNDIVAEDEAIEKEKSASKSDDENDEECSDNAAPKESSLCLKKHMADNVMQEFGRAVARTKWNSTKNPQKEPPAALGRGRLDHYNRFHGKWRIIVRDAHFKRRGTLDKNRRNRNPPPLWEALPTRATSDTMSFQILAYDDL